MNNYAWKDDTEEQRMRSLALTFARVNRIIMGDPLVKVTIQNGTDPGALNIAPGYSAYPDVFINKNWFKNFQDTRTLVQLLGLNYHEVSHLMFSPRYFKKTLPSALHQAYSILEDQRIESLFTALYQPAGKYFTEMVVKFFVEDQSSWESAFMLTYGRSFLPLEIRQEFEARFKRPDLARRVRRCIDDYKKFTSSQILADHDKIKALLKRFADLLKEVNPVTPPSHDDCKGGDQMEGQPNQQVEEEAQQEEKSRRDKEKRSGEDQSGFWDEDEDDEENDEDETGDDADESEGEDADEEADGEGGGDGEGDTDSEDEDDAAGEEGEGGNVPGSDEDEGDTDSSSDSGDDSEGTDSDSDGASSDDSENSGSDDGDSGDDPTDESSNGAGSQGSEFDDGELRDYLRDIADAVNEDEVVSNEVKQIKEAMNDTARIDVMDFKPIKNDPQQVGVTTASNLRQITQHFRRLYAEVEPGWRYGSDNGKLNVGRAMLDPDNFDEHFDEWDEGREMESGLEVVIASDFSSSMVSSELIAHACEALWTIKRALDEVEAKTTVIGFHQSVFGVYSRDMKVTRGEWPLFTDIEGATRPAQAFVLSRRILSASKMPNKLFVCITDGAWQGGGAQGEDERRTLPELVEAIPATKMYVGLERKSEIVRRSSMGYRVNGDSRDKFDIEASMTDPVGVVDLVKSTVDKMLRARR